MYFHKQQNEKEITREPYYNYKVRSIYDPKHVRHIYT